MLALRSRVSYDAVMLRGHPETLKDDRLEACPTKASGRTLGRLAWLLLVLVFVVAAGTRVGWVVARHGGSPDAQASPDGVASPDDLAFPDEHAYLLAGRSLAAGNGLIDEFGYRATYMPGYPAFIALFERLDLSLMSLRLTQAILGALVAPFTFMLARRWVMLAWPGFIGSNTTCGTGILPVQMTGWKPVPHRILLDGLSQGRAVVAIPLLAGLAAAVDPFLVFFSGLLLTETLFATVLVATWWVALALIDEDCPMHCGTGILPVVAPARRRCHKNPILMGLKTLILVGLLLICCVMLRPAAIVLVAIVPLGVLIYQRFTARAWLAAAVVVGVVVLGLLPWAARNVGVLGQACWTTTRGGITLYDSVQSGSVGGSDLGHTKADVGAAGLDELAWDRYWHARAIAEIRRDPGRIVLLAGRKFMRMWNIVPNEPGHRRGAPAVVSAVWMVFVLAAAAVGWWHVRRAVGWWVALLAPLVAFTALHMVFIGSVRYRIPVMPMLFVLAAAGVWRLLSRWFDANEREDAGGQATSGTRAAHSLDRSTSEGSSLWADPRLRFGLVKISLGRPTCSAFPFVASQEPSQ